jgi:hypothetical protein
MRLLPPTTIFIFTEFLEFQMDIVTFEQGAAAGVGYGKQEALRRLPRAWIVVVHHGECTYVVVSKTQRTQMVATVRETDPEGWKVVGPEVVRVVDALKTVWPGCPQGGGGAKRVDGRLTSLCRIRVMGSVVITLER